MSHNPFEPITLIRSFLTVASGFLAAQFGYLLIGLALGYLFFPEFIAAFQLEEAERKRLLAENLQAVIPWKMFALHALLSFVALYFVGWLSTSLAPLAYFQHGLFIAFLVFVWFMQAMIADPPSKKVMDAILMIAMPVAIVMGASHASRAFEGYQDPLNEPEESVDSDEAG